MVDGRVVGTHAGIEGYTIGQRKGLGVALGEPHYVVKIDATTNQVVLGRKEDLERTTLTASKVNWLVASPSQTTSTRVQIRYNSAAHPATVTQIAADRCQVEFDGPVHGVAPGQAAVFYEGDRVLGGGWID
jgi:tRNA-specific 2-thiouridylase